ncbi:MAG: amino acid ABC transporter ATP-binding protein [Oscillospiraceae bacterium]|jgi:polar amino acid transport system ATP-binding protein|nr:amino acid ABC transporter ATP-binding protein [Oscillospiraceae bacterium]
MVFLQADRIEKRFGETTVLRGISFSLEEGRTLAIIGSSGSGKTTLLRCLNFLERPDGGRITVRGELLFDSADSGGYSERDIREKRLHFGLVFQAFHLFPHYTALENVVLARELAAMRLPDYKSDKKRILEEIRGDGIRLLDQIGLFSKRDLYPHQLSGGQQQRVAIARALAMGPDILCFDEPTSALDPELTGEVLRVIRSLAEQKTTMIIVTHEMQFAKEVSDSVLFMDEGQAVEYGPPSQVLDNPSSERVKRFLERYTAT